MAAIRTDVNSRTRYNPRPLNPKKYTNKVYRNLTSIHLAASLHQIAGMEESVGIILGKRLRELRVAAHLTQAELATLSLKSIETISNFERGKTIPSIITLASLAKHLDCTLADLFATVKSNPKSDDPVVSTIIGKAKLLGDRDRTLLQGFIDLLISNSRP